MMAGQSSLSAAARRCGRRSRGASSAFVQARIAHVVARRVEDRRVVRVGAEAGARAAHLVRHDEVDPLARQLAAARCLDVVGLGREPHEDLPRIAAAPRARGGCRASARARGRGCRPPSSTSSLEPRFGRKSATAAAITTASASSRVAEHGRPHLLGRRHLGHGHAPRRRHRAGTEHEPHVGPPAGRLGRDRDAHPAARAVAEEPHRVDRLMGRPGRDDDHAPPQVAVVLEGGRRTRPRSTRARPCDRCPRRRGRAGRRPGRTIGGAPGGERLDVALAWRRAPTCPGASREPRRAGRRTRAASTLSRSSASPSAILAMLLAVAGATTARSASCASPTCSTSPGRSHREVCTGRDGEGGERVGADEPRRGLGHDDRHLRPGPRQAAGPGTRHL